MNILFANFTGVYEREGITGYGRVLDLSDLQGTGMYIDEEAEREIKKRLIPVMKGEEKPFLRFLDNGNYHYMSRILASFEESPFDLITFDHHSDDQPPAIAGLRSCGSWRLDIREENKSLRSSLLIRSREDLEKLMNEGVAGDLPIYISVDKDILSEKVLHTNWDQGDLSEAELSDALSMLMDTGRVTALDICGEDLPDMPFEDNKSFNTRMIEGIMKKSV